MLSPPEADLVRRDPALPGLATLLDPEAFATALRPRLPSEELMAARRDYVRYKPGMSCLVAYRVETARGVVDVSARAVRPDADDKLRKARGAAGGHGRFVLEDRAIVVSV